jgi:hypothetical protein
VVETIFLHALLHFVFASLKERDAKQWQEKLGGVLLSITAGV